MLGRRIAVTAAIAIAIALVPAQAKRKIKHGIEPGPTEISAEERALAASPAEGIEHAIVLVNEYARNEDLDAYMETSLHFRAKILSNEGRDLADIEIPIRRQGGKIPVWWGRTLLPDGEVLELGREEIDEQLKASAGSKGIEWIKVALPGVVPGSVIDFGYTVRERGWVPLDSVPLQRRYLTKSFRYHWRPYSLLGAAFRMARDEGLNVRHDATAREIVIEAEDLPPFRSEPSMPPIDEARGMLHLYYLPRYANLDNYWDKTSEIYETTVRASMRRGSIKDALRTIQPAPEGTLLEKLKALYDWIGSELTRTGLRTFEQRAFGDDGRERADIVRQVMENKGGSSWELGLFYIALARELGAEARLVLTVDRTDRYWDYHLKTTSQFASSLVAVGDPGADAESMLVLDPGGGMPFGGVPWWLSGVYGMLVGDKKASPILIPTTAAEATVGRAEVEQEFVDENEVLVTQWSRVGGGQESMGRLRYLSRLSPGDRDRVLDAMCGENSSHELVEKEHSPIDPLATEFSLSCETEQLIDLGDGIGLYQVGFDGPWFDSLPQLDEGERQHPVILDFPRTERATITVRAPEGFRPANAPRGGLLDRGFASYQLDIETTDDAFVVRRDLTLRQVVFTGEKVAPLRKFLEDVRALDAGELQFERQGG